MSHSNTSADDTNLDLVTEGIPLGKDAPHFICMTACFTMSLVGELVIFATFASFKSWERKLSNRILINVVASSFINMILIFYDYMGYFYDIPHPYCIIPSSLMYYTMGARWCWTLVMSSLQFYRINTRMGAPRHVTNLMLKLSLFSWGLPLVSTIYRIIWELNNEAHYCLFIRVLIYEEALIVYLTTVIIPLSIVVLVNVAVVVVYIFIVCFYSCRRSNYGTGWVEVLRRLRTVLLLFFAFEFATLSDLLVHLTNSGSMPLVITLDQCTVLLQGIILFLYFVVFNAHTRNLWKNVIVRMCCKVRRLVAPKQDHVSKNISVIFKSDLMTARYAGRDNEAFSNLP